MKIAQICTNVMSGSVGSIVRNICDGIKESDNEYLICYGRGKQPDGYNSYKFDNKIDIYIHVILARLFDSDGLHSKRATKRLINKLNDFKPDVVHIHCLHGYYINYPLLVEYLNKHNVKVVWTMHDCWSFTGHCCYFDMIKCEKWKYNCNNCMQKHSYPKSIGFDNSKYNFNLKKKILLSFNTDNLIIVSPSNWLKSLIKESFLRQYNCLIINNGIDTSLFNKKDIKKERIILGVASIWDKRKGLEDFIELKKFLLDEYKIKIIGVTKKQKELLQHNNIQAIERTSSVHELVEEYNKALVLFNPTYEDNFPTVNLEAVSCGTPVITYRTGGSPEFLVDDSYGFVVDYKDYKSIVNIIKKIHENKEIKKAKIYDKAIMVKKYLKIYESCLNDENI